MAGRGNPKGVGRKPGTANTRTREIADKAAQEGITPLEYMLAVMRDETAETAHRHDMAKAAAPYIHPRLAAMEHKGPDGGPIRHVVEVYIIDPNDKG